MTLVLRVFPWSPGDEEPAREYHVAAGEETTGAL